MLGFDYQQLPSDKAFVDDYLVMDETKSDRREMGLLCSIIQEVISFNNLKPLTNKIKLAPEAQRALDEKEKKRSTTPTRVTNSERLDQMKK